MPTLWTSQFHIANGAAHEKSSSIGIFQNTGPSRKSALYVLTDTYNTDKPDDLNAQVVGAIEREFRRAGLSVTSALTSAINAAHTTVTSANAGKEADHLPMAGVTCAALTNKELYIAQAGPSLGYIYNGEKIRRYTPPSITGDVSGEDAIGVARSLSINLQAHQLNGGDVLLLSSPRLSSLISNDELAIILTAEPDKAIQRVYLIAKQEENFSALLVAMLE